MNDFLLGFEIKPNKRDMYCKDMEGIHYCESIKGVCEHKDKCNFIKVVRQVNSLCRKGMSYSKAVWSVV